MNELITHTFRETKIRTSVQDGEILFVAKDVCEALEIRRHKDAISNLDADEKGGLVLTAPRDGGAGGSQQMVTVNEAGLYRLILRSRKPQARVFSRWVTHEILPAIRRSGGYFANEAFTNMGAELEKLSGQVAALAAAVANQKIIESKMKTVFNIMLDIAKTHSKQAEIMVRLLKA